MQEPSFAPTAANSALNELFVKAVDKKETLHEKKQLEMVVRTLHTADSL